MKTYEEPRLFDLTDPTIRCLIPPSGLKALRIRERLMGASRC